MRNKGGLINKVPKRYIHSTEYLYNTNKPDVDVLKSDIKSLHSSYIRELYKDRNAPVIPFHKESLLATCTKFSDKKMRVKFLKEWGSNSGIYIIEYKYDPLIYYSRQLIRLYNTKAVNCVQIGSVRGNKFMSVIQASKVRKINPWFLTGFTDAEGCFRLAIKKNKKVKLGWSVELRFKISLHKKDKYLLYLIQNYFGGGKVYNDGVNAFKLIISSIKDLQVVLDHFNKYSLVTKKRADFDLFKQAFYLILNKEHLNTEGFKRLVSIKGSINLGLSPELKSVFPDIIKVERPLVLEDSQKIPDPNWLAGFANGEGCFFINRQNRSTLKLGVHIVLRFQLTQHSRDEKLMQSFVDYFQCGKYFSVSGQEAGHFIVSSLSDIVEKIIPFFNEYKLIGEKREDFQAWCKAAELMKSKKHFTPEGLEEILEIKAKMNQYN